MRFTAITGVAHSQLKHWYEAVTGSVVGAIVLIVEHYTGRPLTWSWFCASVAVGLAWHYRSELKKEQLHKAPNHIPQLYLFYDRNFGGVGVSGYTGLFLRTEDQRVASKIRIRSADTVSVHHTKLRIRWTDPGQNVGTAALPVILQCVTVRADRESTISSIEGEQLNYYFERASGVDPKLIVTLDYCDIHGNPCPTRRFILYRDPKVLPLLPIRIICEPIKD